MRQAVIKSWWLLAFCGVLYAMFSFLILSLSPDGSLYLRPWVTARGMISLLGRLALAAGVCTIAAAIWNARKSNSWFLALNGLACSGLGLLLGATRPVAFRSVALFIVLMGASIGVHELVTARTLRGHLVDEWLLAAAGVVSVGFAGVFLGFALGWIRLEPSPSGQTFYWLGTYFGFGAICLLGLAARQLRPPATIHRISDSALPAR
jgi:uncharacterized membrane protein HdeD (DUF308 family)